MKRNTVIGCALFVQAIAVSVILAVTGETLESPVRYTDVPLTTVNVTAATVVLLVFAGVMRVLAALGRDLRWVEYSQLSAITVFLVAQLNGITDIAALVPIYALSAAGTLFLVLHSRSGDRLTYTFGAAVGIVPWGVIAFYEIATGPAPLVRVITLGMLAAAIATWTLAYRKSTRAFVLVGAVGTSVLAWLVLAAALA